MVGFFGKFNKNVRSFHAARERRRVARLFFVDIGEFEVLHTIDCLPIY